MVLAVGLGVAEMVSLDLILIMIAVGALVGALAALASFPLILQVLLAAGASTAMLALVRPNLARSCIRGPTWSRDEKLVGQQAVVTEEAVRSSPDASLAGIWSPATTVLTIAQARRSRCSRSAAPRRPSIPSAS
jgi:membrane protein implicated in regulation of membrane protease activity